MLSIFFGFANEQIYVAVPVAFALQIVRVIGIPRLYTFITLRFTQIATSIWISMIDAVCEDSVLAVNKNVMDLGMRPRFIIIDNLFLRTFNTLVSIVGAGDRQRDHN